MLFKLICFILATTAMIKGLVGIFAHNKLYGWAEKHYAKPGKSITVKIFVGYAVLILLLTWYATLFQYQSYGWIVTVFITLMSIKTVGLLFNWEKTSQKFVSLIKSGQKILWVLDIIVIGLSLLFYGLGIFIY
jgi:hypothetical protein